MNNPRLTLKRVIALGPCHSAETIRAWYPDRTRVRLSTVLRDDRIEHDDKVWISVRVLPRPVVEEWLELVVERAIRCVVGKSGCPAWETWATAWLDGTGRSAEAADAAAGAAWDANRHAKAYAAARAARAAATAHADAYAAPWAARAARAVKKERDRQIAELLAIAK